MSYYERVLITIISEAALENKLISIAKDFGVAGYTILEARGEGAQGLRPGDFEYSKNIKFEVLCTSETSDKICEEIKARCFEDYALILYRSNVSVMRPNKFG